MTELLKQAFEAACQMEPVEQDAVALLVLNFIENTEPLAIRAEHAEAIAEGLAQADRGEFASDEEVEEAFRSFRR